ncbi:nonribosomal peptide synthase [Aspergillus viridinutans]|uniref:Nonribosomal peptide synthase n=1 Tax=Aspergillus viridinutans TaxID=75553 RepID=A0A9P3C5H3_ASPVI|nr:nonribosomal peptide synthase [Aspergillus viridinutans]GIK05541.1 nonribosomal peptide synthase [Aspergillus viridinutans]
MYQRGWGREARVKRLTEWAGIFAVSRQIRTAEDRKSIGYLVNATAWIVDPLNHQKLAPIGAVGELVIEGPSLAQGYRGDAERTTSVFIQRPPWLVLPALAKGDGSAPRVYKTGDLVRYAEDGSLVYVRRKDNQVKIHGQRLEIGEVEYHVRQLFPQAKTVIVMIHEHPDAGSHQRNLIALTLHPAKNGHTGFSRGEVGFMAGDQEYQSQVEHVKDGLRSRLPAFMIPQLFLPLSQIPTTITGKADRRSLCRDVNKLSYAQLHGLTTQGVRTRAARGKAEEAIHAAVCDVLGLASERFGMHDDFFHLGGNSASAMKLTMSVRRRGLRLMIRDVFNHPVLADLASAASLSNGCEGPAVRTMQLLEPESVSELKQLAVSQCCIDEDVVEDIYPSTALQEGLIAMTARDASLYKARVICKLRSNVGIGSLKAAWERVVQLNDILRTRFIVSPSHGTFQVVCKAPFSWAQAQNLQDRIQQSDELTHRAGDNLVHAYIIPDEEDRDSASAFVFVAHHALCDQWSIRLLLDQLTAAYGHCKLPSNRFSAFIRYLSKRKSEFKEYWIRQFQGLEAVVFPPLPSPSYTPGASEQVDYVMNLLEKSNTQITTASYIKLAWAVVISCNTGVNDTVFGITVNGRGAAVDGVGEMTGPTIATIPQRIKLLPEQTVKGTLAEIQAHSLEVIPYEQAGLQNIQKYSPEAKSASMFQSQLIIQPCPPSPPDLFKNCDFSASQTGGFSAYGLSLECQMTHDDRHCEVTATFDPGMISRERVQRLLQHLELVLQVAMSDPTRKVGDLPRMSRQDWDQIQRWNGNLPSTSRQCVHDIVHELSQCLCVTAPDGDLSYAELIQSANDVAAQLVTHGVEPGSYIPVLFEKCKWSPVAMLGVLKAGAAFVLLDPSYPPQRLHAICDGLKCEIVLCSKNMRERAASLTSSAIAIYDNAECLADVPSATLPVVSSGDPAYVVFTSGSTGTPKGATIDHQSYCSSAVAHNRAHCLDRDSRVLQYASYAFDVSIMETLSTLMAGGCVCILSDSERHDHFAESIQRLAVTHAFLTPSTARLLMQRELPSLRVLVMGGEAMSPADCSYWMKRVRLMNEYGIAECAVASTIREISDVGQRDIGFPMGVVAWIVDQNDHETPVAIGATGELLIEGPSVGRGYFDNLEATRRAFIEQPGWLRAVRDGKPSRVYKTGDLVQYNEDGSLNFIGRKDSQIKIRGQRFELEEVEHHLRQIDEIQEATAVVAPPSDRQKQPYLVAFIVPRGRKSFCVHSANALITHPTEEFRHLAGAIQSKLRSILPAHMVPSVYLPVSRMPKTSSDKVDRCRLKEEVGKWSWSDLQSFSVSNTARRAPSTRVEQDLQRVWSQILGIPLDSIGVEDSFFHLGGDSITAMQVVAKARSCGLEHSIQDINQLKSIEAIARKVGVLPSDIAQPVVKDEVTDELFGLTPIQEFFFEMYPEGTRRFNQNILVHFQRQVADSDVERAAITLVQNHAILRSRYARQKDGSWKQFLAGYTKQCFHFRMHKVNSIQEMRHIIGQSQTSLDPEHGPVFTVDLFDHDGQQSLFMIGHHLVLDLASWRIILADMEAMILDPQHEPQLTMSFQTWARLQAEYGAHQLEPPPVHQLCRIDELSMRKFWGAENNANTGGDSKTRLIRLNEQITNKLFGPSSQALDVEPVELLHAAILLSFVRTFPHRPAPCIFGEAHGRETWDASIDVTQTVGWFTTLWPVLAQVSPSDSLVTAVRTVRQARRAMEMHGWKHFTSIYHNTTQERCSAGTHLMEITFNYAGKFQQVEQAGGLFRMEPMAKQNLFDGAGELGRWAMLEINSVILNGMLEFHVTYNRGTDEARVLTPWMDNLVKCLEDLASTYA